MKNSTLPHEERPVRRPGVLKHGNPSGDPTTAPRCLARNRRGTLCQCPAMRGKRRCRLHGGLSTGARTPAGKERQRAAVTITGLYSQRWIEGRRQIRRLQRLCRAFEREGLIFEAQDAAEAVLELVDSL
jgi:hypothetical protein